MKKILWFNKKRGHFILGLVFLFFGLIYKSVSAQENHFVKLSWLGEKVPILSTGVSWGVPLPEGKVDPSSLYSLKNDHGQDMPFQSWPLAYWSDSSLKWVGLVYLQW